MTLPDVTNDITSLNRAESLDAVRVPSNIHTGGPRIVFAERMTSCRRFPMALATSWSVP